MTCVNVNSKLESKLGHALNFLNPSMQHRESTGFSRSHINHITEGVNTLTQLVGCSRPRGQHRVELFLRVSCHVFRGVTIHGVWDSII